MPKVHALMVAINEYPIPSHRLRGCLNDLNLFKTYLKNHFNEDQYEWLEPLELTNEKATREEIIEGFKLFHEAENDDICLFYYSGHGSQVAAPMAFWHDEPNRMLQSIVCWDSRISGGRDLMDKELSFLIWEATKDKNVHFLSVMDSCHSGSATRDTDVTPRMAKANPLPSKLEDFLGYDSYKKVEIDGNLELTPPRGRYLALSAAQDRQTAKEALVNGKHHGFFTYNLVQALKKANGRLNYSELINKVNVSVANYVEDQSPQLEATDADDKQRLVLGGAIKPTEPTCQVFFDEELGWMIDQGAIQGMVASKPGQETRLKLEGLNIKLTVTKVHPNRSEVEGMPANQPRKVYEAKVIARATPRIKVAFAEDLPKKVHTAIKKELKESEPVYFELTTIPKADYFIRGVDDTLRLTRPGDPRPVFERIPGYDKAAIIDLANKIEHVGKWRSVMDLANPASTIRPDEIKVEMYRVSDPGNYEDDAAAELLDLSDPAVFRYELVKGKWKRPAMRLKITNTSHRELWVSALFLGNNFGVTNQFLQKARLEPGKGEIWMVDRLPNGKQYRTLVVGLDDAYLSWGVTEITEHLKIIISTDEIDTDVLNQKGLKLDAKKAEGKHRFMGRDEPVEGPDWTTKEIAFTIVRPKESLEMTPGESTEFAGLGVSIETPEGFSGQVTLAPVSEASRAVGVPAPHQVAGFKNFAAFELTEGNFKTPGLSVMEFYNVEGKENITANNPLIVRLPKDKAEENPVLPIGYDAETGLYYPLGGTDNEGKVVIEALPDEGPSGTKSLGGSIKIFFQKVVLSKLFGTYEYPLLQMARVDQGEELKYVKDTQQISEAVEKAETVALFIHGIIGDTLEMAKAVERAKNTDGKSMNELYDLVLTFDYENLETPIDQTARDLKQRLEASGLVPGHGKTLHIIAHSMGGLVSRWFIEKEGGNDYVSHLIQLGTPNGGSEWASVQEMATVLIARAINGAAFLQPWLAPLSFATKYVEKVFTTLQQMHPKDSPFLQNLNDGTDPGIPYSIIAGNTSLIPVQFTKKETSLFKKIISRFRNRGHYLALDNLLFKTNNDIAVRVESILEIPEKENRQYPPIEGEVACDHISYFSHPAGLEALATYVFKLLAQSKLPPESNGGTNAGSNTAQGSETESETEAESSDPDSAGSLNGDLETLKITEDELKALLENENTAPHTLEKYFDIDLSAPFNPTYSLKPEVEIIYPDSPDDTLSERGMQEIVISLANNVARRRRRKKFSNSLNQNPKAIKIVSEGDSWFQHPHPDVRDTIDHLQDYYAVYSVGAAGDDLRNMFQEAEYLKAIKEIDPDIFLLSAGGNDILGSQFRYFLADSFAAAPIGINARRFLKAKFFDELSRLGNIYNTIVTKLHKLKPDMYILVHGYDYCIPGSDRNKGWLGRYMLEKGIEQREDCQALIKVIIDAFNEEITKQISGHENVYFVDLRGTVREDQWYDEIHPNSDGFQDIAVKYQNLIDALIKEKV